MVVRVVHYVAADGADAFDKWFRMQNSEVRARVQTRLDRIELGNFGDHRSVGDGVSELRIDAGPGYRVYFGRDGNDLVVLLAGGAKKRQATDIATAQAGWKAYKEEKHHARQAT